MNIEELDEIKGSISIKTINGRQYCYLKFRDDSTVKTVYIGKPGSEKVIEIEKKLEQYRLEKKKTLRSPRLGRYIVQLKRDKKHWDDIHGVISVTRTYAEGYIAAFRSFDKKTPVRIITTNEDVIGEY